MYTIPINNKSLLVFILLMLFAVPILLVAQDISIDDFRIPTSKYQRLLGGLSGGWYKPDYYYYSPASFYEYSNSQQTSNLHAALDYDLGDFSEARSLEIVIRFNGGGVYGKSSNSWINQSNNQLSKEVNKTNNLSFAPSVRYSHYVTPDLWHWFVEGSGNYLFNETKRSTEQILNTATTNETSYNKNNYWNTSIGGGVGYGKMRDGSAIFTVLRLLDKLGKDSLLIRSITKEEILRLVDLLARRDEYVYTQDRYVKFLMEDLFAELQKMGVLKSNTPTPYSVLRAVEVLSERIETRLFGWRARLGIQRSFYEQTQVNSYVSNSLYSWRSQDLLQLAFDYGYPVSLNLHITSNFSMNIPRIDYQRKINFNFSARGIYQVGEMIDATLSGSFYRNQWLNSSSEDQDNFTRSIRYTIDASFRFFIENNVYFSIGGEYNNYQEYGYYPDGIIKNSNEGPRITFGVNYRFF